jgi:hypothetical protein
MAAVVEPHVQRQRKPNEHALQPAGDCRPACGRLYRVVAAFGALRCLACLDRGG